MKKWVWDGLKILLVAKWEAQQNMAGYYCNNKEPQKGWKTASAILLLMSEEQEKFTNICS